MLVKAARCHARASMSNILGHAKRSFMNMSAPRPYRTRRPSSHISGQITVPGDKSISHRALMFGALAVGQTRISGLLEGEDVLRTEAAMRALGAEITRAGDDWLVCGRGLGGLIEPATVLDMGNSGTAARLLTGILATHDLYAVMTGDESLCKRPMGRVMTPLRATGAQFFARQGQRLPLTILGARTPAPLRYILPVASAQVKSAVLLAGLNAPGFTEIEEPTLTRDHTENMLRHFGADITVTPLAQGCHIRLKGQPELRAADVRVPGDPSSAAFVLAAALMVPGSEVTVHNIGLNPRRTGLFTTLEEMGAQLHVFNRRVSGGEDVGDITAQFSRLYGVDVPADRAPSMIDEYPILAALCAYAQGTSRLRGLAELRVKESDRLAATAALLAVNGVNFSLEGDDLVIHGGAGVIPGGGLVATQMDHRLAMTALILGQATQNPVQIDDARFIDTSFPGFLRLMRGLGAEIYEA